MGKGRPIVKYMDTQYVVTCAKMAEPIKMPFVLLAWVDPGKHVLDGDPDPPMQRSSY